METKERYCNCCGCRRQCCCEYRENCARKMEQEARFDEREWLIVAFLIYAFLEYLFSKLPIENAGGLTILGTAVILIVIWLLMQWYRDRFHQNKKSSFQK